MDNDSNNNSNNTFISADILSQDARFRMPYVIPELAQLFRQQVVVHDTNKAQHTAEIFNPDSLTADARQRYDEARKMCFDYNIDSQTAKTQNNKPVNGVVSNYENGVQFLEPNYISGTIPQSASGYTFKRGFFGKLLHGAAFFLLACIPVFGWLYLSSRYRRIQPGEIGVARTLGKLSLYEPEVINPAATVTLKGASNKTVNFKPKNIFLLNPFAKLEIVRVDKDFHNDGEFTLCNIQDQHIGLGKHGPGEPVFMNSGRYIIIDPNFKMGNINDSNKRTVKKDELYIQNGSARILRIPEGQMTVGRVAQRVVLFFNSLAENGRFVFRNTENVAIERPRAQTADGQEITDRFFRIGDAISTPDGQFRVLRVGANEAVVIESIDDLSPKKGVHGLRQGTHLLPNAKWRVIQHGKEAHKKEVLLTTLTDTQFKMHVVTLDSFELDIDVEVVFKVKDEVELYKSQGPEYISLLSQNVTRELRELYQHHPWNITPRRPQQPEDGEHAAEDLDNTSLVRGGYNSAECKDEREEMLERVKKVFKDKGLEITQINVKDENPRNQAVRDEYANTAAASMKVRNKAANIVANAELAKREALYKAEADSIGMLTAAKAEKDAAEFRKSALIAQADAEAQAVTLKGDAQAKVNQKLAAAQMQGVLDTLVTAKLPSEDVAKILYATMVAPHIPANTYVVGGGMDNVIASLGGSQGNKFLGQYAANRLANQSQQNSNATPNANSNANTAKRGLRRSNSLN